jgi:N-acylneuraminate cytidylyltransferase
VGERSVEVLALIPARGGSKRLPRKNLRLLGGKPLLVWTIEHALASRLITRTIVSTDDDEIAEVAARAGAEVPFRRPPELAGDASPDLDAFRHALVWLRDHDSYEPELLVHLRPTEPLRDPVVIDRAIEALAADSTADSLRAVVPARPTPYKMWLLEGDYLAPLLGVEGIAEPWNEQSTRLPEVWAQSGYVDVVRADVVLRQDSMTGSRIRAFPVHDAGIDIDTEADLARAEALLEEAAGGAG